MYKLMIHGFLRRSYIVMVLTILSVLSNTSTALETEDGWVGGGPLPPNNTDLKSLAQLPDGRLLAGTKTGGIFISNPEISKWETNAFGLTAGDGQDAKSIAVLESGMVVVGTKDGVFYSEDSGETFTRSEGLDNTLSQSDSGFSTSSLNTKISLALQNSQPVLPAHVNVEDFYHSQLKLHPTPDFQVLAESDTKDARFLTVDPVNPSQVHLATKGGYFLSQDEGKTWSGYSEGLSGDELDVKAVVVQFEPYTILLGTKIGLFKSSNPETEPWEFVSFGPVEEFGFTSLDEAEFKGMAFNADFSSLYAAVKIKQENEDGQKREIKTVIRSDDGGTNWSVTTLPSEAEVKEFGLAPHPSDPEEILVGDKNGNLFQSDDRGDTWDEVNAPDVNEEIKVLLRDGGSPETTWFAGTKEGFFKTEISGQTWQDVNKGLISAAAEVKDLVVDPNSPTALFAGTKSGLWFTEQGAETIGEGWTELTQGISTLFDLDVRRVLVDFTNDSSGNTIFLAAKFDIFKYSNVDGSFLWLDSSNGIPAFEKDGKMQKDIKWITQDPENPSMLYISRKKEIRLEDGTEVRTGEVYRSGDGGNNWIKITSDEQFSGEQTGDAKTVSILGDWIYVGTKAGMFRGNKNDSLPIQFEAVNEGLIAEPGKNEIDIKTVEVSNDGTKLFAGIKTGIFLNENHSDFWTDITGNLPAEKPDEPFKKEVEAIHFDSMQRLWVGSKKNGVFFTSNPLNASWVEKTGNLPEGKPLELKSITSAPSESTRFYIGTKSGAFTRIIPGDTGIPDWSVFE